MGPTCNQDFRCVGQRALEFVTKAGQMTALGYSCVQTENRQCETGLYSYG